MHQINTGIAWKRVAAVSTIASLALALSACGGDDETDATPADDATEPTAEAGAPPTSDGDDAADGDAADGDAADVTDLSATQECLEGLGVDVEPANETNTALSPEMNASLGIEAMLVFDKGAGWGGTIEAYASTDEADVAEAGYIDSPFGFEVGRVDDIVFKTTGPAEDITQIEGCLTGEASAAPDEAAESVDVDDVDDGGDAGAARAGIVDMLIDPDLEAQGVIFDRTCLETWTQGLPDSDATLLFDNGGDTEDPAVSSDGAAHAELVFTCLDLDQLAVRYADELAVDADCVRTVFAEFDLDDAVTQAAGDIDPLFGLLATAAEGCE